MLEQYFTVFCYVFCYRLDLDRSGGKKVKKESESPDTLQASSTNHNRTYLDKAEYQV